MTHHPDNSLLANIVADVNSRRKEGDQEVIIKNGKLKASYDFGISFIEIDLSRTKKKYSFTLSNGVSCIWQPDNRFIKLSWDFDSGIKRKNETLFIVKDQSLIAKVDFVIYKINELIDIDDFIYACDSDTQASYDFAMAIGKVFELDKRMEFFYNEEYVEFKLLQVTKQFKGTRLWVDAINQFIEKRFKSSNCVYMVMKAFPVEYTGLVDDDLPKKNHKDFHARQAAMLRYYSKVLHTELIDNDDVWLFRKLSNS